MEPRGSRGRARSVLAASPCATWAGEAAPRAARPSPRHADPCAYRSSSALSGLLLRSRRGTRRYSLPPTSDGLGRFCAPWRLCISRVPARQGWCQGQINCQGWCQGQINCLAGAKAQRLSSLSARSALSLPPSLPPSHPLPSSLLSPSSSLLSPPLSSPLLSSSHPLPSPPLLSPPPLPQQLPRGRTGRSSAAP